MLARFTFKYRLLTAGIMMIFISGFIPYSSQLHFLDSEDNTYTIYTIGIAHFAWYVFLVCTVVLFSIGFFTGHIAAKVAFYLLLPFLTLGSAFIAMMMTVTWGATPFVPQYESGFLLEIGGCIFIVLATIISMHSFKQKKKNTHETEVLDS